MRIMRSDFYGWDFSFKIRKNGPVHTFIFPHIYMRDIVAKRTVTIVRKVNYRKLRD